MSSISSSLYGGTAASLNCPPKYPVFSHNVTLCPLSAVINAASSPAGLPPITRIFLLFSALLTLYLFSFPALGLTVHSTGFPEKRASKQCPQAMQGLISLYRPSYAFRGHSGSTISGLPIATKSAFPSFITLLAS